MPQAILRKSWLRLSRWCVLMLGAVFASSAWGERPEMKTPGTAAAPSAQRDPLLGEVLVRAEGTKIYISQGGSPFEELSLEETSDASVLRNLLSDAGAAKTPISIPVGSIIVASGGGGADGAKPKPPATTGTRQKEPAPHRRDAPR